MPAPSIIAQGVEMFVKSINAKCDTETAKTVRTMTLVDLESARDKYTYQTKVTVTMDAPDGVAPGDVLSLTVTFKRDILEEELLREAELQTVEV